jgi:hypothetical protein
MVFQGKLALGGWGIGASGSASSNQEEGPAFQQERISSRSRCINPRNPWIWRGRERESLVAGCCFSSKGMWVMTCFERGRERLLLLLLQICFL